MWYGFVIASLCMLVFSTNSHAGLMPIEYASFNPTESYPREAAFFLHGGWSSTIIGQEYRQPGVGDSYTAFFLIERFEPYKAYENRAVSEFNISNLFRGTYYLKFRQTSFLPSSVYNANGLAELYGYQGDGRVLHLDTEQVNYGDGIQENIYVSPNIEDFYSGEYIGTYCIQRESYSDVSSGNSITDTYIDISGFMNYAISENWSFIGFNFHNIGATGVYSAPEIVSTKISTVPLPPTIWMFGSGLIGLVGRRKGSSLFRVEMYGKPGWCFSPDFGVQPDLCRRGKE